MNLPEHRPVDLPVYTQGICLLSRVWLVLTVLSVVESLIFLGRLMYSPDPVSVRREARLYVPPRQNTVPTADQAASSSPDTWLNPPAFSGTVWVDTRSHIYHFPGYRWYGATIQGKYMSEQDALAEDDRAALNEQRPTDFGAHAKTETP